MVELILKVAGTYSMLCRDFRLHLSVTRKDGIVEILNSEDPEGSLILLSLQFCFSSGAKDCIEGLHVRQVLYCWLHPSLLLFCLPPPGLLVIA